MRHLTIGGSTIARTIACPAWVGRSKTVIKKPAGTPANLGNLLHDAMENYYKNGADFESQIENGLTYADIRLADEHLPILNKMVTATEAILDEYDITELVLEPFVQVIPGFAGGSIDMLGISDDGKTALILDYKTGRGIVRAEDNAQLLFYTLCAKTDDTTKMMFKDVENFVAAIVQPHVYGQSADVFEFDNATLDRFVTKVGKAIEAVQSDKPKAVAGSHCHYCPNASLCKEKREQAKTAYLINTKDKKSLSEAVTLAKDLKSWCDNVIQDAEFYMGEGAQIEGYKLVEGRSIRKWIDDKEAKHVLYKILGDDVYSTKIITPTQATKLLYKADIEGKYYDYLVTKKAGKPSVVSITDPREELNTKNINKNLNDFLTNKR